MVRWVVGLAVALCVAHPAAITAQDQSRQCSFNARYPTGILEGGFDEQGVEVVFARDPFDVTCADGTIIRANSGRIYQQRGEVFLVGDVFFEDTERTLTATDATYNRNTAFLSAHGNVEFIDRSDGTVIRGPELEYFRATEQRPAAQMNATQRPTLIVPPKPDAENQEPLQLTADAITMLGEDDLSAFGAVEITRSDMSSESDEARYNSTTEDLELRRSAVIRSDEYEFTGEVIQATISEGKLEHLRSRANATLSGDELRVEGDDLQLFFTDDQISRAISVAAKEGEAAQARVISPRFRLDADSLDAQFEEKHLHEVHAIGRARGEAIDTADATAVGNAASATPAALTAETILHQDWITGDTLIGYFIPKEDAEPDADPVTPDSASAVSSESIELDRLVSIGSAQSIFRIRGRNDATGERRNINFLIADRIELELLDGELQLAQVEGLKYGQYLEAQPETTPAAPPATATPVVNGGGQ
jgi:hypothetical protein